MLWDIQSAIPFVAVFLGVVLIYLRVRHRWPAARLLFLAGFVIYLTIVAGYVIFPINTDGEFVDVMRRQGDWLAGTNLVPIIGLSPTGEPRQFFGNLLIGIPIGLGLPFVLGGRGVKVIGVGIAITVAIELAQLAMNAVYGFSYRVVDINDVILNVTGVLIGYGLFLAGRAVYARVMPPGTGYLDQVMAT
jgi:glycopeptide antibiotics resistance protein